MYISKFTKNAAEFGEFLRWNYIKNSKEKTNLIWSIQKKKFVKLFRQKKNKIKYFRSKLSKNNL